MKLPEPAVRLPHGKYMGVILTDTPYSPFYTESQMRQAIKDAFEECEKLCDKFNWGQAPAMIKEAILQRKETI